MGKRMFDALTRYEVICSVTAVEAVSLRDVRAFLQENYGQKMADAFAADFLISSRGS